jgi:hypothetical protein
VVVGGVENADGDDGGLSPGGLAQRPHQRSLRRDRSVDLDHQPGVLPPWEKRLQAPAPDGVPGFRCLDGGVRMRRIARTGPSERRLLGLP